MPCPSRGPQALHSLSQFQKGSIPYGFNSYLAVVQVVPKVRKPDVSRLSKQAYLVTYHPILCVSGFCKASLPRSLIRLFIIYKWLHFNHFIMIRVRK